MGAEYRRWNYSGVILASTIGGRKGDMPNPPDSGMFRASATTQRARNGSTQASLLRSSRSDALFMQYRCPVGRGPSGKTWPR
jgi:hypothetical protein